MIIESATSSTFIGSYAIHGIANSNTEQMYYKFPTVAGQIYQISLYAKSENGINSYAGIGTNFNNFNLGTLGAFSSTQWTPLQASIIGTGGNAYLRVAESSGSNNANFWIDAINIRSIGSANLGNAHISGRFEHHGDSIGFFGATPAPQQTAVDSPTGGATVDAESRIAIQGILDLLERFGLTE
jgi:hypothetical protein